MSVFRRLVNVGRGKVRGWASELPDPDALLGAEPPGGAPQPNDERLARLARARDRGALTPEQFEARRAEILLERAAEQGRAAAAETPGPGAQPPPEPPARPDLGTPRKRNL